MPDHPVLFMIPDGATTGDFRSNWRLIRRRIGSAATTEPEALDRFWDEWATEWGSSSENQRDCATEDVLMTAFFVLAEACASSPTPGKHIKCILPEYHAGLVVLFAFADKECECMFAGDQLVDFDGPFGSNPNNTWQEQFGRMLDRCARKRMSQFFLTYTSPLQRQPPPWSPVDPD